MKRICLKDIAQAAGVSTVTASIALNGSGNSRNRVRVSPARQEEIRRIAASMGYRASAAGRILKSKTLDDIGLLFFEEAHHIREHSGFTDLNIQFTKNCRKLGIRCQTDWFDPINHPDELPELLTDGLVGGLLIAGNPRGASERFLREQSTLPYIRIEEPGEYSVMFDQRPAMRQAMEYLAATGHKRVGLINGPEIFPKFLTVRDTFAALCEEFRFADWRSYYYENAPYYENFAQNATLSERRLLDRPDRPDALLVCSGMLAFSVISLAQQAGLRIPVDLSVITFGTCDWEAEKFVPRLTAIEHNYNEIAERAVDMLRELMKTGRVRESQILVPEHFTIRDTVLKRT